MSIQLRRHGACVWILRNDAFLFFDCRRDATATARFDFFFGGVWMTDECSRLFFVSLVAVRVGTETDGGDALVRGKLYVERGVGFDRGKEHEVGGV